MRKVLACDSALGYEDIHNVQLKAFNGWGWWGWGCLGMG
jgi:hypothetical protein